MQKTTEFLAQLHERTEALLQKAVATWQMTPSSHMEQAPAPGAWSAAQCLEHLNIYSRHYLPAIERTILYGRRKDLRAVEQAQSGWLGAWFTRLMAPQTDGALKSKMKAPKNAVPSEQPDARAMLAEYIDWGEKMLKLLQAAAEVNLNALRVPTSLSPLVRMRLCDTFAFVIAHMERHALQIERALAAARAQKAVTQPA